MLLLCGRMINPLVEKTLSTGADETGTHKSRRARTFKWGYTDAFLKMRPQSSDASCEKSSTSSSIRSTTLGRVRLAHVSWSLGNAKRLFLFEVGVVVPLAWSAVDSWIISTVFEEFVPLICNAALTTNRLVSSHRRILTSSGSFEWMIERKPKRASKNGELEEKSDHCRVRMLIEAFGHHPCQVQIAVAILRIELASTSATPCTNYQHILN